MPRPNFLFFMSDHQQARTFADDACHTPNMDRVSAAGVRFACAALRPGMCHGQISR